MNNAGELNGVDAPNPNHESLPAQDVLQDMRRQAGRMRIWTRQLGQVAAVAAMAFLCYLVISHFLVQSVTVVGMSMSPTLQNSERYLLNRWVYYLRSPEPNDLVVLRDPLDKGFSVKRVIAVEGDSVQVKEGSVFINGKKAYEPYLQPGTATFPVRGKEKTFKCSRGQYFVLGDNRGNSIDSRDYGPVSRPDILGLIVR